MDVGGPGFLADPGLPRPSMADVMSNLRVRLEGARLIGLAALNEGEAHEDPDPEFEGRYRNRTECLKGEDVKAELRAPTWQSRASTLYRLSCGPYAAAETAPLACLADPR